MFYCDLRDIRLLGRRRDGQEVSNNFIIQATENELSEEINIEVSSISPVPTQDLMSRLICIINVRE